MTITIDPVNIDLVVIKTDSADPVNVNTAFSYTLSVTNNGPAAATSISVVDTLPTGVIYVDFSGTGWTCVYDLPTHTVTCTRASLGVEETAPDITLNVTAPSTSGTVTNAVTVSADQTDTDDTNDNDSEETLVVQGDPDYVIKEMLGTNQPDSVSVDPEVAIGEIVSYRVTMTIPPGTFTDAHLIDTLGRGLAFVNCVGFTASSDKLSSDLTGGGLDAICSHATIAEYPAGSLADEDQGRQVTWDLGTLVNSNTANETLAIEYRAVVIDNLDNQDGTTLNNSAVFGWDETDLEPAVPEVPLTVIEPDLTLLKTASTTIAAVGDELEFTLTIDHSALSNQNAYDTILVDELPAELQYVDSSLNSAAGTQVPDVYCGYNALTQTIRAEWSNFTLSGGNAVITFRATVLAIPDEGITNTATLSWTSLPGTPDACVTCAPGVQSPYNDLSTERFFDPGNPVNVYGTNDSLDIEPAQQALVPPPLARVQLLPATGFAPGRLTRLPAQSVSYAELGDLWLEIPRLNVKMPIVGVPQANGLWDVSWLGSQAGWLNGTAYPTLSGNSVLTGHVYDAFGKPGPFVHLNWLWYGDKVIVHASGAQYVYEVRQVTQVAPNKVASAITHEDLPWVTLITCRGYDEDSDSYKYRVVVKTVLVEVK